MKIPSFLSSLLPTFSKDRIIEDINVTHGEITEYTQRAYSLAAQDWKNHKFKSEHMKPFLGAFERHLKGHGNFIVNIDAGFKNILANLEETKKLVEATYNEDVGGAGVTYLKANLLQFVELVGFVSKYARQLLIYAYAAETDGQEGSGISFSESIPPAQRDWLKSNMQNFYVAFNIVSVSPDEFKRKIKDIPDIVVKPEAGDALSAALGDKKLDPFNMKLIPVWLNPIYHVRMFVAQWQTERYHQAKLELQLLQLHKLHLEKVRAGKSDAALEKQIEYTQNQISKLASKIRDMEEEAGMHSQGVSA